VQAPWPEERERIAIDSYWTDHGKATRLIGWEPTWSLADGLSSTLAHHRSRLAWQA
jgi:nucleoside-diphosphate-sugar epimerase